MKVIETIYVLIIVINFFVCLFPIQQNNYSRFIFVTFREDEL